MSKTPPSNVRAELLRRSADRCLRTGLTNFSLRALAKEIGTSHRMLIYHFGTGDGLFRSILQELRTRNIARFVDVFRPVKSMPQFRAAMRKLWVHLISTENRNYMISYLEIQIAAIRDDEHRENSPYLAATLENWLDPIFSTFIRLGFSTRDSRVLARTVLSGGRGLILDALGAGTSGDQREVERAFGRLTDMLPEPSAVPNRRAAARR